ncbi:helix-turn-helix domain-containing protein [Deinococcus peraridilitoris]|uniref:Uncharacterized protein n=1 Tax=Deinococcus peraridilitoris (strain DSM 19664 / LMG 22246 / CIP 109416 / KR-200) TaxID=937777 RepID=K9ZZ12_DEIPD|nr:hypothetical protein [Deinococcus peraridilitoris]AFZ66444.1 hypothetical protein Deipe_0873 [Deinococcus peraridilitoris DSM 19664]
MAAPPTVTVKIREALRYALQRAQKTGRTQQLELDQDLFVRIAGTGRRFLLFQLEGEPTTEQAQAVADALGFTLPRFGWHQGETLRSLTVHDASGDTE